MGAGGTIVKVGGSWGWEGEENAKRSNGDVRNARACAAPTVATLSAQLREGINRSLARSSTLLRPQEFAVLFCCPGIDIGKVDRRSETIASVRAVLYPADITERYNTEIQPFNL